MLALILIFFVLPFEIAFVDSPNVPDPTDGLYIFNRVIDLIFVLDLGLTFFIALPKGDAVEEEDEDMFSEDDQRVGLMKRKVHYEFGLRPIARRYAHLPCTPLAHPFRVFPFSRRARR